jgi:hypothetical protein
MPRTKGTPNKKTQTLFDLAKKLKVDPFEILLRFASEDWKGLGYENRTTTKFTNAGIEFEEYIIEPRMRLKAAAEACQYLLPKRKAIEQSVDPELLEAIKSLDGKTEDELLAIVNKERLK